LVKETHNYNSYGDVNKAIDNLSSSGGDFYQLFTVYDKSSDADPQAAVKVDLMGARLDLNSAVGDPAIHLSSSDLKLTETFSGKTRAESLHMLAHWARDNAGSLIKRANSLPSMNGVAGTPASATTILLQQDFNLTEGTYGQTDPNVVSGGAGKDENKFSLGARFSSYTLQNKNANVVTLPLGYTLNFDSGYALIFSLPLTYADFNGTPSYSASLGIGLKLPVSNWLGMGKYHTWALTPMVRGGAVGSDKNIGSTGIIYSGSILSEYDIQINDYVIGLKNMYSYYVTTSISQYLNLKVDDVKLNVPDIQNSIFRNGVYVSRYLFGQEIFGRKLSGTLFFVDTRFVGSALYANNQQEVGFTLGLAPRSEAEITSTSFLRRKLDSQDIRLGFTYTSAKNIDGYSVNFGFSF
jgi:hypothetical protein